MSFNKFVRYSTIITKDRGRGIRRRHLSRKDNLLISPDHHHHCHRFLLSSTSLLDASSFTTTSQSQSLRSITSTLLPRPQPDPLEIQQKKQNEDAGKKKVSFFQAMSLAWRDYKLTWVGFFDNWESKEDNAAADNVNYQDRIKDKILENVNDENIIDGQAQIRKNVKRNIKTLRKEGAEVVEVVKDFTGISTKEELTKWAMDQLRLANECVGEFMKGYRRSRDEEIDKMMNQYFQEFDEDGNSSVAEEKVIVKPGRRKRRRKSKW